MASGKKPAARASKELSSTTFSKDNKTVSLPELPLRKCREKDKG